MFHIHINTEEDLVKSFESIGIYGVKEVIPECIDKDLVDVCPMSDPHKKYIEGCCLFGHILD